MEQLLFLSENYRQCKRSQLTLYGLYRIYRKGICMFHLLELNIAEHRLVMEVPSDTLYTWAARTFCAVPATSYTFASPIDLILSANVGYGQSFDGRPAQISCTAAFIQYWRSDFLIVVSLDYSEATIEAYDLLALNQALLTLYSALITYREWGLLVRATCWIEDGRVLMSADTSSPRPFMTNEKPFAHTLLSDEAALIKVSGDHLRAFNSPFRSGSLRNPLEIHLNGELDECLLNRPTLHSRRIRLSETEAVSRLRHLLAFQALDTHESAKTAAMCRAAVRAVPFYELQAPVPDAFLSQAHEHVYAESV